MSRRVFACALLSAAAVLAAASSVFVAHGRQVEPDGRLSKEFHLTRPLPAEGRVTLKNITGAVRVAAWDRDEVRIDAVKRAYTQQRLDEADISVSATADGVHVRTVYPEGDLSFERGSRDNPATVEYVLTVPRRARVDSIELINGPLDIEGLAGTVKATTINGRLRARDLAGEARLSTVNGALEVVLERLSAGTVVLSSVNGTVDLTLPADADATLRAATVHGEVSNDLGLPVRRGPFAGATLEGRMGAGAARVRADNVNGSVRIRRAADGRTQSPVTNLLGPPPPGSPDQ